MKDNREASVVLITGSTDGIGRAAALEAARAGHGVIVHGRGEQRVDVVLEEIRRIGGAEPRGVTEDLASLSEVRELARRLDGTGVTAVSLHPGVINTKVLHEYFSGGAPTEQGARNVLTPALDPVYADHTGEYFSDARPKDPDPAGRNRETARRLREVSEKLCRS